ncbi:MAG TPA: hypothetical protein PK006_09595 [Saprospiraceae bacterium]|nr:hypothetical protein [Saprospiraceae bacterium]
MFYSAITSNKSKSNFVLYHWNENKHEVKLHPFSIGKEEPSNEAVFVKLYCNFATEPPLSFKRDTFGKIIRANLELEAYCDILVKGLDIAESMVINSELIQLFVGEKHSIPIPYSDYFSSDAVNLKTSNPAKYDKIASKIRQDFAEKIKETYFSIIRNNSYKIYEANAEFLCSDDKIFDVVPQDNCTDNSVKEIEINGGSRDGLVSGRRYNCLTKREIDQYYYYENLTKVEIKESAFDKSKAKTLLFGSKDLAKSFKAKEKIVVAPSEIERAQNRLNLKPDQKTINVAIVKECLFCIRTLKKPYTVLLQFHL